MKEKIVNGLIKIKENINYKKIFKIMFLLTCIFLFFNALEHITYADGLLDYGGDTNPFNEVKSGWGQFIQDQYRANYKLDTENLGTFDILDKAINGLANMVFYVQVLLSWLGVSIFNLCFEANITNAFSDILTSVSTALHNGVFNKFYMIMFMVSLISIVIYFAKRNYAAVFSHILVVALIVSLSVVIKSDNARIFIVETTGFSREIGESLVNAMVGTSNGEDGESEQKDVNTKDIVGSLWSNLVHKPWMILEFDGKYDVNNESNNSDGMIASKKILSERENSDEREKVFEELGIKNISYTSRLSSAVILFAITLVKLMILIAISVVQVFMQIIGISIILIAPFILLMTIVPFFGGLNLLKWLGEKYLGIQVTIVLLSFIIGVLLLIDSVTLTFFMNLGASFPIALMIQAVCWIMVIVFRKQLIANFNRLQRRVNGSIGAGRVLSKTLDKETELASKAKDKVIDAADKTTAPARKYIKDTTVNMKEAAESKIKYAGKYAAGNVGIKAAKFASSTIDKVASKFNKKDTDVNLDEDSKVEDTTKNDQVYKAKVIDLDKMREARMQSENNNIKDTIQEKKKDDEEVINISADKNKKDMNKKNTIETNRKDNISYKVDEAKEKQETIDLSKERVKVEENKAKEVNRLEKEKKDKSINREKLNKSIDEGNKLKENKNKNKPIDRVEVLKTKLGVSDKQIKTKERNLNRELKKITNGSKKGR
ncbi:hypothetical protein [Clostridium cuniculi]|uniref:hypothetical protein n=1 Tax=Clostridium cuniculi TaxID=2548455 RepID=UPI001055269E|nr:hypothetical protein [Clostridium cuniculi]